MGLGLQTARALVIDDVYHEAQPVLLALSRLGIGSVYLNGSVELLPQDDGFRGIRIAFVDMDLQGDGTTPPEDLGRQAATYLARALSPDNGMLAALLWTKHPEAAESFFAELRDLLPNSAVLEMGVERKPTTGPGTGQATQEEAIYKIQTCVNGCLEGAPGMRLLWQWEQVTHEAVTATTEKLIEVVSKGPNVDLSDTESVSSGLISTLGLLSSTAGDRSPETGIEAAAQAFSALVPILEDGAEQASERFRSIAEHNLTDLLSVAKSSDSRKDQSPQNRAKYGRLNRMVHVSRRPLPRVPLLPGNVYQICDKLATALPFDSVQLLDSMTGKAKVSVGLGAIPVIAEVSPACDYANTKVGIPRVLGGILVREEILKKIPSHGYIYKSFGVFQFDENEVDGLAAGIFHFALNARFLTGVSAALFGEVAPLFRIRQNTLVDLQAWLARYGSRPGVTTIAS